MKKTLVLTAGLSLGVFGAAAVQARQVCHDVQVKHIQSQDTHRVIGTGVGAVAGGLLGHQVGGGKGKTLATVGGAVAGGVVGNQVQKNAQNQKAYYTTERRCEEVQD